MANTRVNDEQQGRLDYGVALRRLRAERGFGLNDLAFRAGVSPSHLSEVERGVKRPSTDVLARLARAFGMAPSELLAYIEASAIMSAVVPEGKVGVGARQPPALAFADASLDAGAVGESRARDAQSAREHTLQVLLRLARRLSDDDLQLLRDLARRLLERKR